MDDTVARFWDKYINKTTACNVPEGARRWYVKHVEALISAHPDHRLAELGTAEIIKYLEVIGRKPEMADWRYRQIVDALRILYTEILKPEWAASFDWQAWFDSARDLGIDHATLARIPDSRENVANGSLTSLDNSATKQCEQRFPVLFERMVMEVRVRNYSIRTEQSYISWVMRFVLFSGFETMDDIQPDRIAACRRK
jgi:hypothetical protein